MEKIENNVAGLTEVKKLMDFLAGLGEIQDSDIQNFRKELPGKLVEAFDKMSEERKIIIFFIERLPQQEIEQLCKLTQERNEKREINLGFHEINFAFRFLVFTNNPKYNFLKRSSGKENQP